MSFVESTLNFAREVNKWKDSASRATISQLESAQRELQITGITKDLDQVFLRLINEALKEKIESLESKE